MRRRTDMPVAFVAALAMHALLAAGAVAWRQARSPLLPAFVAGESSVALTLVAAPLPPPEPEVVEPPPEPEVIEPEPEAPVLLPEVAPVSEVLVEPPPVVEPPVEPPVPPETPAPEADADLLDKGAEAAAIDTAGVRPLYPLGSRVRGEEGLVELSVEVDARGRAREVLVVASSGHAALDRAAVRAAWKARYLDAAGGTRAGEVTFAVRFKLVD